MTFIQDDLFLPSLYTTRKWTGLEILKNWEGGAFLELSSNSADWTVPPIQENAQGHSAGCVFKDFPLSTVCRPEQ